METEQSSSSPLRIIERIIVKESSKEHGARSKGNNETNPLTHDTDSLPPNQDPRVNTLITNLADLTTRVDERYGVSANLGGSYSNAALFNMISQFQRIKTLDDVKITNATIEGYASSKSVSDSFLPLAGGTLTGGLTGTTLTLSGLSSITGANLSGVLNASSTTHITATSTFGNLIRIEGTGTSTILGRLSISATSTMAGYRICTQENNVCAGGAFSSSGGLTTLRTATDLVGIGTSSPIATFGLKGSQYLTGGLGVGNATTSGILETSGIAYFGGIVKGASTFTFAGTGASIMQGALGIATTTPAERFSINGGVFFDSDIIRYGSSSQPTLRFQYAASSTSTIPNLTSAFTYATSTTNTPLLTLSTKSSRYGRIGIGTSSPSALFAINALNASNQADNLFYVGSSTINAFVVDNHGNVGVGTSSRSTSKARLAVTGFGTGTNRLLALADANDVERFTVQENGNVGIGTINPGSRLEVENTASADDVLLLEDSSGLCEAQPATTGLTWSCSSDIRLKTNIRDASPVLTYITGIPLRDYTVIKTNEEAMGPIAQELQETNPELVREGDDGYLQVSALSSWQVVKAIQELNKKLDAGIASLASGSLAMTEGNSWTIDQQTGRLTTKYALDLGGNSIQNVSAILSASGSWSIDESGKLVVREIESEKLKVKSATFGSQEKPEGITIYDKITGQPICAFFADGIWTSESGACGSTVPEPSPSLTP